MTREDVRSDEELTFYLWLLEAHRYGFISGFEYESETLTIHDDWWYAKSIYMKTKVKSETARIFATTGGSDGVQYTPDFIFNLTTKGRMMWRDNLFAASIQNQALPNKVYVDIKGGFAGHGGGHGTFFLKQRLLWDSHKILVHKVNPSVFFKRTWAPESLRWMRGRLTPTLTKLGRSTCTSAEFYEKNKWRMKTNEG